MLESLDICILFFKAKEAHALLERNILYGFELEFLHF